MFHEEKKFNLRFNLEACFPDDYNGDSDAYVWLHEWESRVKPDLLKIIFNALRKFPSWSVHVRNRGIATLDEVEIALVKDFSVESTK